MTGSKDDMSATKLTEHHIKIFLVAFFASMVFLVPVYLGNREGKDKAEFLSYICPCAAGVLAGAGLYFRRKLDETKNTVDPFGVGGTPKKGWWPPSEQWFYAISVFFLFLGLLAYVLGHQGCRAPALVVLGAFMSVAGTWVFTSLVINDKSPARKFMYLDGFAWALLMPIVIWAVVVGLYYLPRLFLSSWDGWLPSITCLS